MNPYGIWSSPPDPEMIEIPASTPPSSDLLSRLMSGRGVTFDGEFYPIVEGGGEVNDELCSMVISGRCGPDLLGVSIIFEWKSGAISCFYIHQYESDDCTSALCLLGNEPIAERYMELKENVEFMKDDVRS